MGRIIQKDLHVIATVAVCLEYRMSNLVASVIIFLPIAYAYLEFVSKYELHKMHVAWTGAVREGAATSLIDSFCEESFFRMAH